VDEIPPLEPKASGDLAACHFPLEPGENLAEDRPGIAQDEATVAVAGATGGTELGSEEPPHPA
jgi:hypothetical protein